MKDISNYYNKKKKVERKKSDFDNEVKKEISEISILPQKIEESIIEQKSSSLINIKVIKIIVFGLLLKTILDGLLLLYKDKPNQLTFLSLYIMFLLLLTDGNGISSSSLSS